MNNKPGYKTTEFWMSFTAVLLGFVVSSGVLIEGSQIERVVGMAVSTLAALGYTAARAKIKSSGSIDGPELP